MSDRSDNLIGGRYLVVRSLRQTHLCETFIAQDTQLPGNPLCIVKQLKPQSNEQFVLKTARRLFDNEANVLYKLGNHPQIPRLLAHLQVKDRFYLVQEFIEGKDLSDGEISADNQELWTEEKTRNFLEDVLNILAFVHQNKVIHRDIKPSNLIRRKNDGKIVLIDFGAVKEVTSVNAIEEGADTANHTVVVGTPGYMAPEQHRGQPRLNSDIYALGMTLIHGMTGCYPDELPRDDFDDRLLWRDRAPQCGSKLADIIDKMICANSSVQRYQNVGEVLEALAKSRKRSIKTETISTVRDRDRKWGWKTWLGLIVAPLFLGAIIFSPRIWNAIKALNYYTEGNSLIQAGKYEEAIAAFEKAIQAHPNFTQALTNKGFAQGKLGKAAEKFASCVQATNVAPDFAEAWNCRGLARFDLQDYDAALQEYERALAVEGDFHRAWFNKGQVYMKLGQYEEAIAATEKVLVIEPNYSLAWTQICRAWFQLQDYQQAKKHCDRSLEIEPKHQPTIDLAAQIEPRLP